MENYNKNIEKNLLDMVKLKEEADKRLLTMEIVIGLMSCFILFLLIFFASFVEIEDWLRILFMVMGFIPFIIGMLFAIKIEQTAGYYKCGKCNNRYVPTFSSVLWSMHIHRTRYMRCPKCNKRSWNKKVLLREENNN